MVEGIDRGYGERKSGQKIKGTNGGRNPSKIKRLVVITLFQKKYPK